MHKSFIERIFPQPSSPFLPTSQSERRTSRISLPSTPSPVAPGPSLSRPRPQHASPEASLYLQPTPLSASIIHHSDPLLPVDRAARALQKTIQSLLDAQSNGLAAGLGAGTHDDVSSAGSLTPTPSVATPPRSATGLKTTPVRQPVPKKITLRGARKGLMRSMQDFVQLKDEELRVLDSESKGRQNVLDKLHTFDEKRTALNAQVDAIKHEGTKISAEKLHKEAQQLDVEIKELEDRLFYVKAKQRHILDQASQIENSVGSKMSAYASSLEMLDREIKQFLKRPPLQSKLPAEVSMGQSIYDLKPERRTLEMAKEQWSHEQQFLDDKRAAAEQEKAALKEGALIWRETVDRINTFEKDLRLATGNLSKSDANTSSPEKDIHDLLPKLDASIDFLENKLHFVEENNWNLLICCLGPELEAFQQGRTILRQTLGLPPLDSTPESEEDADGPDQDLMNGGGLHSPGLESNKSLEDTMAAFGNLRPLTDDPKGKGLVRGPSAGLRQDGGFGFGPTKADSESEEDDPGPDFLLSHS